MKIVAIIQARMGSTRFPGKVLETICGKAMITHVIERTKEAKRISQIIVATTSSEKDDRLVREVEQIEVISVFRGNEEDVLERYYRAAQQNGAEVIVRITSDCPLIDPAIMDRMIEVYVKRITERTPVDYLSNTLVRTFPRGLDAEVFSLNALERAFHEAKKYYQREHVTPYIWRHPRKFTLECFKNNEDLSFHRWTVDEKEDLQLIREIYRELYGEGRCIHFKEVIDLFTRRPHLCEINAHITQKELVH